tara:strand:- start:98 stop:370 length:273 start_codon:yes stop_codon:yes gene_type:complete
VNCHKVRNGRSIKTIMEDEFQSTVFHEIDNLDTKEIEQAENNYEKVFIRIRKLLKGKPWCCDDENDTLFICQAIADDLRSNLLIRKDNLK